MAFDTVEEFATRSENDKLVAKMQRKKKVTMDKAILFYSNRNEDIKNGLTPAQVNYE